MAIVKLCAIYDNLVGYKNVHAVQNLAVAERGFTNSIFHVLDGGEFIDVSPADLSLYHVGDFDMDTGEVIPVEPHAIVHGTSLIPEWNNRKFNSMDNNKTEQKEVKK